MTDLLGLYHLAAKNGIVVDCFDLQKREALSVMDEDGACYIAIDPFKLSSDIDEKMKLAHELGHSMTGSFYNEYATCDIRQKHEHRADRWAIHTLIPQSELALALASGRSEPWDLAEYFGVTEDFMRKALCLYLNGNLAVEYY